MEHERFDAVKRKSSSVNSLGVVCKLLKRETIICDLPDDIIYEIFKYIPPIDLYFSVFKVSKRWQSICLHQSYWRRIKITNLDSTTERVCEFLKAIGYRIHELHLSNRPDCDKILTQVWKYNKNLDVLSLSHCGGKPGTPFISSKVIKEIILKLRKLQSLSLYGTTFRSVKFFEIFGSEKFTLLRSKSSASRICLTYTGTINYKQLEAYTRNLNNSGRIILHNGKEYSIRRVREILGHKNFDPNSVVYNLEDF